MQHYYVWSANLQRLNYYNGSVFIKDVPDNSVVGGVPAKYLKSANELLEKIKGSSLHLSHLKGDKKD